MIERNVLHDPFDLETHKNTFINYLEVVIDRHGVVHYAVPSHQEFLIRLVCEEKGWTRDELSDACPPEYYADFMDWLLLVSEAVAVWNSFYKGELNQKQLDKLYEFHKEGLYTGNLTK